MPEYHLPAATQAMLRARDPNRGANYRRAAQVLPFIAAHPGLSAWEISEQAGIPYTDVSKGLEKARSYETRQLVRYVAEDRAQGGQRYRYFVVPGWEIAVEEWRELGFL